MTESCVYSWEGAKMKAVLGNKFRDVNAVENAEFKGIKAQIPIVEHEQVVALISTRGS